MAAYIQKKELAAYSHHFMDIILFFTRAICFRESRTYKYPAFLHIYRCLFSPAIIKIVVSSDFDYTVRLWSLAIRNCAMSIHWFAQKQPFVVCINRRFRQPRTVGLFFGVINHMHYRANRFPQKDIFLILHTYIDVADGSNDTLRLAHGLACGIGRFDLLYMAQMRQQIFATVNYLSSANHRTVSLFLQSPIRQRTITRMENMCKNDSRQTYIRAWTEWI